MAEVQHRSRSGGSSKTRLSYRSLARRTAVKQLTMRARSRSRWPLTRSPRSTARRKPGGHVAAGDPGRLDAIRSPTRRAYSRQMGLHGISRTYTGVADGVVGTALCTWRAQCLTASLTAKPAEIAPVQRTKRHIRASTSTGWGPYQPSWRHAYGSTTSVPTMVDWWPGTP